MDSSREIKSTVDNLTQIPSISGNLRDYGSYDTNLKQTGILIVYSLAFCFNRC